MKEGRAAGTINHGITVVNQILKLAATEWRNEYGSTWLEHSSKLKVLPDKNKRQPYPLTWHEQRKLFAELPDHLEEVALFAVNTGCRDQEVWNLLWEWEIEVEELDASVFLISGEHTKNGEDRLVVLNRIAKSVIDSCRGRHETHVFTYRGKPTSRALNSAWMRARDAVGLPQRRFHDMIRMYDAFE